MTALMPGSSTTCDSNVSSSSLPLPNTMRAGSMPVRAPIAAERARQVGSG